MTRAPVEIFEGVEPVGWELNFYTRNTPALVPSSRSA